MDVNVRHHLNLLEVDHQTKMLLPKFTKEGLA